MPNNKYNNLPGTRFGKLVVVEECDRSKHGDRMWKCRCDCGAETVIRTSTLTRGDAKSCGCMIGDNLRKHNHSKERLHNVWKKMRSRCLIPTEKAYKNYGGRGIRICPEWDDYMNFRNWAYENGYDENAKFGECTLDRIDVNGNYCPENCRFVNFGIQANNRRDNCIYFLNGKRYTLMQLSKMSGINYNTLNGRLKNYGWTLERAISEPPKRGKDREQCVAM